MQAPFREIVLALRRLEYYLLLPFVFCATYFEAAPASTRENILRGASSTAMMVAGLAGVNIIRSLY